MVIYLRPKACLETIRFIEILEHARQKWYTKNKSVVKKDFRLQTTIKQWNSDNRVSVFSTTKNPVCINLI